MTLSTPYTKMQKMTFTEENMSELIYNPIMAYRKYIV